MSAGDAVCNVLISDYILYETFESLFLSFADGADFRRAVAGTQVAAYFTPPHRKSKPIPV